MGSYTSCNGNKINCNSEILTQCCSFTKPEEHHHFFNGFCTLVYHCVYTRHNIHTAPDSRWISITEVSHHSLSIVMA